MEKKFLILLFIIIFPLVVTGEQTLPTDEADGSIMLIGIRSRSEKPIVTSVTLVKGRGSHSSLRCRDDAEGLVPGQCSRPLLLIYNSSREILFKAAFNYPVARTVPLAVETGAGDVPPDAEAIPGEILLAEPEVYLPVPYFTGASYIEVYSPGKSEPGAVKQITKDSMEIYSRESAEGDFSPLVPPPSEEGTFHLLIIASGFSTGEMGTFTAKANELKAYILSVDPFRIYAADIDIHIYENLADLGCYTGCSGIDRLLCCTTKSVIAAAAASGYRFDEIIVLHNTDKYSGGGYREYQDAYKTNSSGTYAASYTGSAFKQVSMHEFGHSFGNLCDEYTYTTEGYSYTPCVNCRENCIAWSPISSACQQGCSARSDYFRPEESIMLTLGLEYFNSVSMYATYLPDGMVKRLLFFINKAMPLQITLQVERKQERARVIKRDYGQIDFLVDNPGDLSFSTCQVYRKSPGGNYQLIKEISYSDMQNSGFSFIDKYLDKDLYYTYKVEILDSLGAVLGVSSEETI